VEGEDGVTVEADLLRGTDKELDCILVVQDHLRFEPLLSFRLFAEADETSGVEQGIGVALKTAGIP